MADERPILGYDKFLMMALLREGQLSLAQLREKSMMFISLIWYQQLPGKGDLLEEKLLFKVAKLRSRLEDGRSTKAIGATEDEIEKLVQKELVQEKDDKYSLTETGREAAAGYKKEMDQLASTVEERELQPAGTAKRTTVLDAFLALLKFSMGLITGSAGLISDGTDATMDTVTAFLVWLGIKYNRQRLTTFIVILGLFVASISVGFNAVQHIIRAFTGTLEPIDFPYLVIAVEGLTILAAFFLFYYQRYVGKVARNLTLVSQSVDSKNHIFIGFSVIVGAIFAIFGIYFVDAVIGLFIAAGIFKDAVDLLREAISSRGEEQGDYSRYRLPLEKCWESNRLMAFRTWILYALWSRRAKTRQEIVSSLEGAFSPDNYIPVVSELKADCREQYDFDGEFANLVQPLAEQGLLTVEGDEYHLTEAGGHHLGDFINNFRYYDVHRSDAIMLAMAEDRGEKAA